MALVIKKSICLLKSGCGLQPGYQKIAFVLEKGDSYCGREDKKEYLDRRERIVIWLGI